tara:strand:+ start:114 stop:515 length:402 start_codon:yes stop_codon:yes gene_type:complete
MKFSYNELLDRWETPASFGEKEFRLSVLSDYLEQDRVEVARRALAKLETGWGEVESKLVKTLLSVHNDSWAEPEEGFPELAAEEFLSKLVLTAVDVLEEEALSLYLSDSGIFGGHCVTGFWDADGLHEPALAG